MGGGDLNLKKSWHPQTMKNIERVWKAEQKHEAEVKKMEELQKELKEERSREEMTKYAEKSGAIKKKDDRLDWMYQGPAGQVSRDEYLLGRSIDKQVTDQYEEPESGPSAETGLLPGSIFNLTTTASNLDLAAKIREDPLFEIRKREEEKKREVLTNPVKMRKIKEMLRQNLDKKDKKKKRKKDKKEKKADKEKRKEKKHKRRSSNSSSDEEDEKKHRSHARDDSSSNTKHRSLPPPGYGLQLHAGRHHQSSAPSNHSRRDRSRSQSPHRSSRDSHSHSSSSHRSDRKLEAKNSSQEMKSYRRQTNHVSKKLSPEELERKRLEMMNEAKQRDEDRENNLKRYEKQEEQERQLEKSVKHERHAGFIHDMKLESAASSSLEDRVRRNIHSIQRTPASMGNFLKR